MAILFNDQFTRANSPTIGNGWIEETSTVYEILNNKLRITPDAGGFSVNRCFRPISENFADGNIQVDFQFVIGQGVSSIPGIEFRMQGAGDLSGYSVLISGALLVISRIDSNVSVPTLNSVNIGTLVEGVNYQLLGAISGTAITGTLINIDTGITLGSISAIDSTYPGAGKTGVAANTGGKIDFDNFITSNPSSVATTTFTDSFTRADSTVAGNNWFEERPSAYQILGNKLRFTGDGSTSFANNRCFRPIGENFADGAVQIDFQFQSTTSTTFIDIQGRLQGANELNGYIVFTANSTTFSLGRLDAGVLTTLSTIQVASFVIGTNYQMKLKMIGSSLQGILVNVDTSTTLASLSATDSTYLLLGRSALSVDTSGTVDFDNAAIGLELITITTLNIGDIGLLERFNNTLIDWVLDTTGGTASIQNLDNSPKLQLNDTSATLNVKATKTLNLSIATRYIIEVDMYCVASAVGYIELLDSSNTLLSFVKNDGGINQGTFDTDSGTPSTFTWTAAEYKMIVLSIDPVNNTISAWYTIGTGNPISNWVQIGTSKNFTGATIDKIRFRTDNATQGEFRVDEIKVYVPNIFCLGDSNTAGFSFGQRWSPIPNSTDRTGTMEVETHSYPLKLGQDFSPQAWCANRGISADRTDHIDARVQSDIIDQKALICVVLIGTNDIIQLIPEATIKTNILSVRDKLLAAGVNAVLCTIPPSDNWTTAQNTTRSNLNSFISGLKFGNSVKISDVYLAVRDPSFPDKRLPAYIDPSSNEHFNETGLQVIANTVFATTQSITLGKGSAIYYYKRTTEG